MRFRDARPDASLFLQLLAEQLMETLFASTASHEVAMKVSLSCDHDYSVPMCICVSLVLLLSDNQIFLYLSLSLAYICMVCCMSG